jgi:HSP20 family protein
MYGPRRADISPACHGFVHPKSRPPASPNTGPAGSLDRCLNDFRSTVPLEWGGNPFRAMQRFANEIDRMFADIGIGRHMSLPLPRTTDVDLWAPDIDVVQRNNELTIKADLPGLRREDVLIDITDDAVTIQGERKLEREEEREGIYRTERSYGSFCRVIPLPEGAMTDQAKATFRDGVLEVIMPAPPASKGRRLEITERARK